MALVLPDQRCDSRYANPPPSNEKEIRHPSQFAMPVVHHRATIGRFNKHRSFRDCGGEMSSRIATPDEVSLWSLRHWERAMQNFREPNGKLKEIWLYFYYAKPN